jgi:lipoprotein LprG
MSQRRGRRLALVLISIALAMVGCSGGTPAEELPNAVELLSRGADAMRSVQSAALDIAADPGVTVVTIRSANGHITSDGRAEGTAVVALDFKTPLEYQLVATDGVLYLKGPTGGFTPLPLSAASGIYDPTAILDPDRGAAAFLAAANQGETEAREVIDGVDCYRVTATFPAQKVVPLVPGVTTDVPGTVWLDVATGRLIRAELRVPDGPTGKGGAVNVRMSEYDAPVTITPPV